MQTRIALRNSGLVDPLSVYEYIQYGGFNAVANGTVGAVSGAIVFASIT